MANSSQKGVSLRAVLLSLLLIPANIYWIIEQEVVRYTHPTLMAPISNVVFLVFVFTVLSLLLKKFAPKLAFSQGELLVCYVMLTAMSSLCSHDMMQILIPTIGHAYWFATPENEWAELFHRYLPDRLTISDHAILRGYYEGETTLYTARYIKAWIEPILWWMLFIVVYIFVMLCINTILRKQWAERERLTYPIIQLPLEMTENRARFFKNKLMWIGFSVAALISIINFLNFLYPSIPEIPIKRRDIDYLFTEKPWNAIGYVSMSFNLAIVGLTYFMPLDLAFSCWFFFWLTRAERVFASIVGWNNLYLNERASGAWIGICVLALWASRRHLMAFAKHVFGLVRMDDSHEPMRYRSAVFLLLLSFAALVLFCYFAGMSLWAILIFYALFYALAIAIGRVRAELGPPYHEVIGINPRQMMVQMFGARRLRGSNLTIITFLYAFNRCNRSHPMPCQIESLKIGDRVGMNSHRLAQAMTLAIGIGAVATFWTYLQVAYHYGTLARCRGWVGNFGWESYNPLQSWLQYPRGTDTRAVTFMGGGFAFVFFLYIMRTRFLWWPLHASGYVLSGASWGGMIYFWFPVMVSWLIKSIILRHGGRGTHRKAIPFFLGLILGDFIPRSIASIVSLVLNLYMPSSGAGHTL